jgi:hypothetical protein
VAKKVFKTIAAREVPMAICIIWSSGNVPKEKSSKREGTVIDPPPIPKRAPNVPEISPISR